MEFLIWITEHWYISIPIFSILAILSNKGDRIQRQQDVEIGIKNAMKKNKKDI